METTDNDAKMIESMGQSVVALQLQYKNAPLKDRITLKPALEELLSDYADYQLKLLKEGVITTDADLVTAADIRAEIDKAAATENLIKAIARTIAFIAAHA